MNVFFAGTPECAVPALNAIIQQHSLIGVLTAPPTRTGRGKKLTESAVAQAIRQLKEQGALASDTPVFTPEKLDRQVRADIAALQPDILVCFAYGKIFGPKTLALFPQGALNIHPSLLPRWRGPSPVPAAIFAGDSVTGVTVQFMAQEMDAGDIVLQQELPIEPTDTTEILLSRCAQTGAALIVQALAMIENNTITPKPQNHAIATYCTLLEKDSGHIIWTKSAREINQQIRAYTPWPGAFTHWNNTKLSILAAHPYTGNNTDKQTQTTAVIGTVLGIDKQEGILIQTGNGILAVQILQRETKKAMHWKDFLNGTPHFIGGLVQ